MPIPSLRSKRRKKDYWRYKPLGGGSVRSPYSPQAWRYKKLYKTGRQGSIIIKLIRIIIPVGILVGFFGLVVLVSLFAWYGKDLPDPDQLLERSLAQSTVIYDRTGENILYEVHGEQRRTMVVLEEIPEYLKWATIVGEDRSFYEHKGFNLKRIFAALVTNILHFGKPVQGASTITQQFVKNAILTPEKRYSRKIKEVILSYQIERKFTKDQILKMYFNEIPYGSNAYGIEAASQIYFGKHASELDLTESTTLAALPKAPTYLYNHPEKLKARRDYILNSMAELGYITQEDAGLAAQEPLELKPRREAIIAPHFVMYVKELLSQHYGERLVERGGLQVYTTLDVEKQKTAEEAILEYAERNEKDYKATNAALVSLDPKTGDILAMVGSRDFYNEEIDGQVNVTLMPRQPGSSFKPVVYAAAFIKGYTPNTILWDVVTTFKTEIGEDYTPHNYDNKERGPVAIRKALAGSLNIPAVKTIYLTGISNVLDLADSLGYTTLYDRSRFGLSLVLGGGEVKLLEHTTAYGVFSQEGIFQLPRAILKVIDASGQVLEEVQEKPKGTQVLDQEICRLLTNILSDNEARAFIFGSNNYLNLGKRPVVAKTGTTNDYLDAWTIGYTPSLVTGVWVGNNNNKEMRRGADGSVVAAPIWKKFMEEALKDSSIEYFTVPKSIEVDKPVLAGKIGSEVVVRIDKVSGKLATDLTPPEMVEEKSFREMHSILHYVDKDNPRGPVPEDPTRDPYYEPWEQAIRNFLAHEKQRREAGEKDAFTFEAPPTEKDDVHTETNRPVVTILSPLADQVINTNTLYSRISAHLPRGKISKVEYYIDNEFFTVSDKSPYNLNKSLVRTINGEHVLTVKVYDDAFNVGKAQVNFKVDLVDVVPEIQWLQPQTNTTFSNDSFPLELRVVIPNPQKQRVGVVRLKFFYQGEEWAQARLLGMVTEPESLESVTLMWSEAPISGTYELFVETEDYKGMMYRSEKVGIEVE